MTSNFRSWPILRIRSSSNTPRRRSSAGCERDLRRRRVAAQQVVLRRRRLVSQRHVARLSIADGKRDPDNAREGGRGAVRNDSERELTCGLELANERVERLGGVDERVILLDGVGRRRVLGHQRAEVETREELVALLARAAVVADGLEVDVQRHVGADGDQLTAPQRVLAVRLQAPRAVSA